MLSLMDILNIRIIYKKEVEMANITGVRPRTVDTFAARKEKKITYNSAPNLALDFARRTQCDLDTVYKKTQKKELF